MALKFKTGDKVWAKMKSYPPWPAVVLDSLPIAKKPGESIAVIFYGPGHQVAWMAAKDVEPFDPNDKNARKPNKALAAAIAEAISGVDLTQVSLTDVAEDGTEAAGGSGDESSSEEEEAESKAAPKKRGRPPKKAPKVSKSSSDDSSDEDSDSKSSAKPPKKSRKSADTIDSDDGGGDSPDGTPVPQQSGDTASGEDKRAKLANLTPEERQRLKAEKLQRKMERARIRAERAARKAAAASGTSEGGATPKEASADISASVTPIPEDDEALHRQLKAQRRAEKIARKLERRAEREKRKREKEEADGSDREEKPAKKHKKHHEDKDRKEKRKDKKDKERKEKKEKEHKKEQDKKSEAPKTPKVETKVAKLDATPKAAPATPAIDYAGQAAALIAKASDEVSQLKVIREELTNQVKTGKPSLGFIDALLARLESFPITIPMMQESGIGKTVRQLTKVQIPKYNLTERFNALFARWNVLVEEFARNQESKPSEPAPPKVVEETARPAEELTKVEEPAKAPETPAKVEAEQTKHDEPTMPTEETPKEASTASTSDAFRPPEDKKEETMEDRATTTQPSETGSMAPANATL